MLTQERNLAFACLHGNVSKVAEILSCAGTLVNKPVYDETTVYYGSTPLHSAAQGTNDTNACKVIKVLFAAGGDPTLLTPTDDEMVANSWSHEDGSETPLMLAVRNQLEGAVALLLAHPGANVVLNWKSDYSERTALHIAVEMPHCWDTDHRYAQTWNAVDNNPAAAWSYVRILLTLLIHGARVTARRRDFESTEDSDRGDQPLHIALINTVNMNFHVMEVVVRLLLHYGAPAKACSASGTPVNLAVHCNNFCITRAVATYAAVGTTDWQDWRHLASLACGYNNQRSATFFAAMMPQTVLQSAQANRYSLYNYVRWLPGQIAIAQSVQDRCLAVRPRFCNHACAPKCIRDAARVCLLLGSRASLHQLEFLPRELWFLILSFLPTPWSAAARCEVPFLPVWVL